MNKVCQICDRDESKIELVPVAIISAPLLELIKKDNPKWNSKGYICKDDLQKFRQTLLLNIVRDEKGELTDLEKNVVDKLTKYESISTNIDKEIYSNISFGEKLSDKIASFGGSWKFIIMFGTIIIIWISINIYFLAIKSFDPYPFILLNLVLSCLAALQAPVIMMSQNRQEARDRDRAEQDYKVNLKAELELRQLHQKVDHLLIQQWERMVEIQELQLEMLGEIKKRDNL
jgi:uncharacterized membrane protein